MESAVSRRLAHLQSGHKTPSVCALSHAKVRLFLSEPRVAFEPRVL